MGYTGKTTPHYETQVVGLNEELDGTRNQELSHGKELRDICVTMGDQLDQRLQHHMRSVPLLHRFPSRAPFIWAHSRLPDCACTTLLEPA